jgi:hypothetical protein
LASEIEQRAVIDGGAASDLPAPCPSCGALNAPGAVVCFACGVRPAAFIAAAGQIRSTQQEQLSAAAAAFAAATAAGAAEEAERSRRRLVLLLRLMFAAAAVVVVALGAAVGLREYRAYFERRDLREMEARATDCLGRGEYECARDGFGAYLKKRPASAEAATGLWQARLGLAKQYDANGRWQQAEDELRQLLERWPDDREAKALLSQVYDHWAADAAARGDWLTVARIRLQRTLQSLGGG